MLLGGRWRAGALVSFCAWTVLTVAAPPGGPSPRSARGGLGDVVAVLLIDDDPTTRMRAAMTVERLGGRVSHAFDGLLIVRLPPASRESLALSPEISRLLTGPIDRGAEAHRGAGARLGLEAWNLVFAGRGPQAGLPFAEDGMAPVPDRIDALEPPRASIASAVEAVGSVASRPYGATPDNTSEYLAGVVSINLIFVESEGSIDRSTEDWTAAREAEVEAGVVAGLDWIAAQEPQATLSFVHHVHAGRIDPRARTSYEPIVRDADPLGSTGEDLWVRQILARMGYPTGDRFARSRALAHDTRVRDGSDWAVNVFVVDSLRDADGAFRDRYFAYAWIGGPHLVMTYDNQSWGIANLHRVLRHEMLHCFYAFDEYSGSGCSCGEHRGYLDGPNGNCVTCNHAADPCVMISNGPDLCERTRRQIGWADLDGDGRIDVVGEDPETVLDAPAVPLCGELRGTASVAPPENRNPFPSTPASSIAINRVAGVEVRVDGGRWEPASPEDGAWDGYQENFLARVAPEAGSHAVEARALDDHGNVDLTVALQWIDVTPPRDPGPTLTVSRFAGGIRLAWGAASGAVAYRVERAAFASGPWGAAAETAAVEWWGDESSGGFYRVRSLDGCGGITEP